MATPRLRIDAHQHFWQLSQPFDHDWLKTPEHQKICRDYLPEDLAPHLKKCGLTHSIFVQTQHRLDENRWALSLADHYDFIAGVVGWVDLASPDCEAQLEEFLQHPRFVGVRHITQGEANDDFVVQSAILRGLKVLERHRVPFDLLFYVKHLKHAATLGRELPELPMVIDHLSKPKIKDHSMQDWIPALQAAARFPNLYCKLSGMVTEADWNHWKPADLRPYVDNVLEAFGPDRCLFGSDWPVCELAGSYEDVYAALQECIGELTPTEQAKIFGETAQKFYSLNVSTPSS